MANHLHWIAVMSVVAAAFASSRVVRRATSLAHDTARLFLALLAAGVAVAAVWEASSERCWLLSFDPTGESA
jgi:hypothetical protein